MQTGISSEDRGLTISNFATREARNEKKTNQSTDLTSIVGIIKEPSAKRYYYSLFSYQLHTSKEPLLRITGLALVHERMP